MFKLFNEGKNVQTLSYCMIKNILAMIMEKRSEILTWITAASDIILPGAMTITGTMTTAPVHVH